jgi:cytidylate kinase
MSRPITIALDGPAGSGKSTLARGLASRLDYRYLDTGAMYRAVALAAERAGIGAGDGPALRELLGRVALRLEASPEGPRVLLGGEDVSAEIRTPEISRIVSAYASRPEVREAMVRLQRDQRGEGGLVAEGRDIGTVVFPDAEVKFYVTADPEERARRRLRDFGADESDRERLAEVREDLRNRDSVDTGRDVSPLARAEDAMVIDTTGLSVAECLRRMEARVAEVTGCSTGS